MNKQLLLAISLMLALLYGCKRRGCMHECASNYDPKAEKDNGACTFYDVQVTFWTNGDTHGPLDIYIDDDSVKRGTIYEYTDDTTGPKDCGAFGTLTVSLQPGRYEVEAQGTCCGYAKSTKIITLDECDECKIFLFED